MTYTQDDIDVLRNAAKDAINEVHEAVMEACPGNRDRDGGHVNRHVPVQHRDRQPPWCPYCGRTADGELVGK